VQLCSLSAPAGSGARTAMVARENSSPRFASVNQAYTAVIYIRSGVILRIIAMPEIDWEKRRSPRQKVFGPALILGPKLESNCVIRDLSSTGAKLEVPAAIELPRAFNLMLLKTNSSRHVLLKWRRGNFAGVAFCLPETDAKHSPSVNAGKMQSRTPAS
jgi:hypothetical protein